MGISARAARFAEEGQGNQGFGDLGFGLSGSRSKVLRRASGKCRAKSLKLCSGFRVQGLGNLGPLLCPVKRLNN